MERTAFYRTLWRWHFYAGLFVMPFVLVLSLTGSIYLFKPQIERWEERHYLALGATGAVSPDIQVDAALTAFPDAQFYSYRLPRTEGSAALIHMGLPDGTMRDVFVSSQGKVLGSMNPETRIPAVVARIHGSLLAGTWGNRLVELAASWAIVMILSGLYLWWPHGRGLAGTIYPRMSKGGRTFLRDLHAVTGFWVAGLGLLLLVTGLPWAGIWGDMFRLVRAEMGWVKGPQSWKIDAGSHAEHGEETIHGAHDHEAMMRQLAKDVPFVSLAKIVTEARHENMPFPVLVLPPGAPQQFGPPTDMVWTVKSEAQNRPLVRSVTYDVASGKELSRSGFADKHPLDRMINYGIAWHEGQLFGWINQIIGVFTALALMTLSITAFLMWLRRRPLGSLGAPSPPATPARMKGVTAIILLLAAFLPLLAASLIVLFLVERLILPYFPSVSAWLGLDIASRTHRIA